MNLIDRSTGSMRLRTMEPTGQTINLNGSSFAMKSVYEHCSDTLDGPDDTCTTARIRLALRNRESGGVERAGTQKRRTRVGVRDKLDTRTQQVATIFAGTEEQIRQIRMVEDRAVPSIAARSSSSFS
jgi:hypothetical protein